ncbi:MAG TPA: DUF6058 family natural product biosynthesis protein [Telluria sp.]|nr:DUF6058 family natural product biosynthesis protein [Telluria sp.]
MTELDNYLATHYLDEVQLAAASGLSIDEHRALIRDRLVPAPSYVVSDSGTVSSFVFGEMAAPGSKPGHYFHPSQLAWIARARSALADGAADDAEVRLKEQFAANFAAALSSLNRSTLRLRDSFDDQGAAIPDGLHTRTDTAWTYFLNGTFGLCVANPISEAHIAHKEVLQEKLTQHSENGQRKAYPKHELAAMEQLIDAYASAAMPFSPVEYARSSRKRLVEDLRAGLSANPA